MREFKLYNNVAMPAIGFGVYQIPPEDTERCVSDALALNLSLNVKDAALGSVTTESGGGPSASSHFSLRLPVYRAH